MFLFNIAIGMVIGLCIGFSIWKNDEQVMREAERMYERASRTLEDAHEQVRKSMALYINARAVLRRSRAHRKAVEKYLSTHIPNFDAWVEPYARTDKGWRN